MANHDAESGFELVVDNRKLILIFVVLIAICTVCFVLGFIEGKNQGSLAGNQNAAVAEQKPNPEFTSSKPGMTPAGTDESTKSSTPPAAGQKLDWYKAVSSRDAVPAAIQPTPATETVVKKPEPARAAAPVEKPKPKAGINQVSYSLQVGAFSQKEALDATMKVLQGKGFECWVDPPQEEGQLYRLMVGRFITRADAAAMRLKLQKNGFSPFIKTNQ